MVTSQVSQILLSQKFEWKGYREELVNELETVGVKEANIKSSSVSTVG